jgi:redox-sensitive bicupin YhaK (pirin superfamily)
MMKRKVVKTLQGKNAIDGAGVRLVRVLSNKDVEDFDPFLMLDSFDSLDSDDYTAGFPMHPHRGIETITYLIKGKIEHEDSMGNKDVIREGESQWMTAGSGILHQEMPIKSDRMLGFQLWLNLPAKDKMTEPAYLSITKNMIPVVHTDEAEVRVLTGSFRGVQGVEPSYIQASVYDIELKAGKTIDIPTYAQEKVFIFLIVGTARIEGQRINEKTAVLFDQGDYIQVSSYDEASCRFIFCSGKALHEPIAWGGPIVMNTKEELQLAFDELDRGTFIKHA